jgi:hypothetical protein
MPAPLNYQPEHRRGMTGAEIDAANAFVERIATATRTVGLALITPILIPFTGCGRRVLLIDYLTMGGGGVVALLCVATLMISTSVAYFAAASSLSAGRVFGATAAIAITSALFLLLTFAAGFFVLFCLPPITMYDKGDWFFVGAMATLLLAVGIYLVLLIRAAILIRAVMSAVLANNREASAIARAQIETAAENSTRAAENPMRAVLPPRPKR